MSPAWSEDYEIVMYAPGLETSTRKRRFIREGDCDAGSLAGVTGDGDGPTVQTGDALDDRQPQADPSGRAAGARRVGPVEAVKDVRQMLRCNAGATVNHLDQDPCVLDVSAKLDAAAAGCVSEGIGHEIAQGTLQQSAIRGHPQSGRDVDAQGDSRLDSGRLVEVAHR